MLNLAAGTKKELGADTYLVQRSLRFRSSASTSITRTFGTPTNIQKWTLSCWIKLGGAISTEGTILGSASGTDIITIGASGTLSFSINSISAGAAVTTTQVFRDPSAWYHIVIAWDTTQATASNRVLFYVNGVQVTSFSAATYPALNSSTGGINKASTVHSIGARASSATIYYDGYMAEYNFVDGQALTPSSFGATNADTGVWRAKAYTGTYGTNGFYLNFSDNSALTTASNAGLGKDNSGNGNFWVTNNISITAGTTYDSMTDVPTNTSATAANYPTLNTLVPFRVFNSYTNGNLTANNGGVNSNQVGVINMTFGTGKYYWETTLTAFSVGGSLGVMDVQNISGSATTIDLGTAAGTYAYLSTGNKSLSGTSSAYGATFTTGDTIAFTYDGSTGVLAAYKNNVSQGTMTTLSTSAQYIAAFGTNNTVGTVTINVNFGQRPFTYTPPSGFVALNTYNLTASTIFQGNKYIDATTYTGNGTTQAITNAGAFKPDFVWIKSRSNATFNHELFDSVRGVGKQIASNTTGVENTTNTLTSFDTSGFSVQKLTSLDGTNASATTYVGWQWRASNAAGVSNTSGSITSTVSANPTAGFSIVTYTGTGANATVGHGLGVAPKMLLIKPRSTAAGWFVWHTSIPNTQYLVLETTAAVATAATGMNSTSPTSTVFSLGSGGANISAATMVAYCFVEIAGFSSFGSYTGNGSTDGTFVYLGFRPKFVLFKQTNTASNWTIADSVRNDTNVVNLQLNPNVTNAEGTNTSTGAPFMDFTSNGFKIRSTSANQNTSGGTYIYMAFAENPFKYSNAR
jgi:hypothetical protein